MVQGRGPCMRKQRAKAGSLQWAEAFYIRRQEMMMMMIKIIATRA